MPLKKLKFELLQEKYSLIFTKPTIKKIIQYNNTQYEISINNEWTMHYEQSDYHTCITEEFMILLIAYIVNTLY